MRKRSRTAAKLAGVVGTLGLMAALVGLAPSANAADVNVSFLTLDGSELNVGDTEFPLFDVDNPQSTGLTGVWDDVTGDFEGDFEFPTRATTQDVTDPVVGTITLLINMDADPVVGTIDPATGEVDLSTTVDVVMTFESLTIPPDPAVALNIDCSMSDIPLELTSEPNGEPFDADAVPPTFAVAADGFTVPLPTCVWNGTGTDPGASIIDLVRNGLIENLVLPSTDTDAFLSFEAGDLVPPDPLPTTTLAPTTTTVAPATQPATAVRATPRVTG